MKRTTASTAIFHWTTVVAAPVTAALIAVVIAFHVNGLVVLT